MKIVKYQCDLCDFVCNEGLGLVKRYRYPNGKDPDPSGNGYITNWEYIDLCCDKCKQQFEKSNKDINLTEVISSDLHETNTQRELNEQEKARGRSPNYHNMSPEDQWAEDKRLGILDWDGN